MIDHENILKNIYKITDIELLVLKCHLMIEAQFNKILESVIPNFTDNDVDKMNLNFFRKAQLCKGFCVRAYDDGIWNFIFALNILRNKYAHSLDEIAVSKPLSKVLELTKLILEDSPAELKFFSDPKLCYIATSTVATLGFLDRFHEDMDMKYSFFKKMQEAEGRV